MSKNFSINQQISAPELRVIAEDGSNLGVISLREALDQAGQAELDLIEISPRATPPVAKIMDYGKFLYLENKKEKGTKQKPVGEELKTLQVKIGTGTHDLELKAKKASEFLAEGHLVKINLFLPGRSKYLDQNFLKERLDRILDLLTENYKVTAAPAKSHKGLTIIIERGNKK